jgi:hypothetical protein
VYAYVEGDPVLFSDPDGFQAFNGQTPPQSIPGGPWQPRPGARPGSFMGPKQPTGPRTICEYVPDKLNGGPSSADRAYWKTQGAGERGWQRYDLSGNELTPDEAHPRPRIRVPFPLRAPLILCPACDFLLPLADRPPDA